MGLLSDGRVVPVNQAKQLENDVAVLRRFYEQYIRFDDLRIAYGSTTQYRGDAETRTSKAYEDMQVAFRDAKVVVDRLEGVSP